MQEEDKKERIFKAALRLFTRFGLNKTTVDEIARDARVGKGTIYHYYETKEHIFNDVVRRESEMLLAHVMAEVKKKRNPKNQIRAFILTKIKYLKSFVNLNCVASETVDEIYPLAQKEREDYFKAEQQLFEDILKAGVNQNLFYIKDIHVVALVLLAALKELERPWIFKEEIIKVENAVDIMLSILFHGIEKR